MAELTKKADVSGLAGTYDAIVGGRRVSRRRGCRARQEQPELEAGEKGFLGVPAGLRAEFGSEVFRQLQLLHEHELLSDLSDDDLSIHLLPEPVLPSVPEHDLPILPEPVL